VADIRANAVVMF